MAPLAFPCDPCSTHRPQEHACPMAPGPTRLGFQGEDSRATEGRPGTSESWWAFLPSLAWSRAARVPKPGGGDGGTRSQCLGLSPQSPGPSWALESQPPLLLKPVHCGSQRAGQPCLVRRWFPGPQGWPSSQPALCVRVNYASEQISGLTYLKVISM